MILLFHETTTHGMIATSAKLGNESHAPRRYQHTGHFVEIDGPAHVVAHDAEEICKIPGYRLATPAEQEAYAASKKKKGSVREQEEK